VIWTTWRQHRAEAWVGVLILAALAATMVVVGSIARDRARSLGLPACAGDAAPASCGDALGRLHDDFHSIPPFVAALVAVPLIAGMFWAAPLVSREYEAGTQRLAWTQSVSPLRWITVKIALIFAAVAAGTLVLGLLATWSLDPLTAAFGGRFNSTWYDVRGVVPVAFILFALAVGVAASALIRRTIPAMAVTLVAYAAARIPLHWIRWHFAPLHSRTVTVPFDILLDNPTGGLHDVATSVLPPDAWLHGIVVTSPSGRRLPVNQANVDVLSRYCPNLRSNATRTGLQNAVECKAKVNDLSIRETITYQPASHFWAIQLVESAIFIGLAALLVTVAVLAVHRRRAA
jgi:hypothetical protein